MVIKTSTVRANPNDRPCAVSYLLKSCVNFSTSPQRGCEVSRATDKDVVLKPCVCLTMSGSVLKSKSLIWATTPIAAPRADRQATRVR